MTVDIDAELAREHATLESPTIRLDPTGDVVAAIDRAGRLIAAAVLYSADFVDDNAEAMEIVRDFESAFGGGE